MKLTIHRQNYGVTPEGEWHQKIDGEWLPIPQPEWSKEKKKDKVVNIASMRMKPPKDKTVIKDVKVYRVIEKVVPEHEAEVLCRNGWQSYYPGSLRHHDSAELSQG